MRTSIECKHRSLIVPASILALLTLARAGQAQTWEHGWHDGWGHMFFGSFMMLLFWGGLIILLVFAVRWLGSGGARRGEEATSSRRALDILEERFARGEIDKEEFEERRRLLSK